MILSSLVGEPSLHEHRRWQFDSHHINVNCLPLGNLLVMTPICMGSEPVALDLGKYAGIRVSRAEEASLRYTIP